MQDKVKIEARIRGFLEAHRVGRLGTADPQGRPHVVPVCYAVGRRRVYSVIDDKPKRVAPGRLKRLRNIVANPHVCLTIDEYSDDWSELGFVMVQGVASVVYSGKEHEEAISLLRRRYAQYRNMDMRARPILSIEPRKIVTWGKV
ncbi:MAG: TIGR03668 family PPOX class F420-dependent oxidoreductase [Dehalococcoidia bacterium]